MSNNDELVKQLLSELKNNSGKTTVILQGITIAIILLKPVLMYFIQAKYNAPPPHESILRNVDESTKTYEYKNNNNIEP